MRCQLVCVRGCVWLHGSLRAITLAVGLLFHCVFPILLYVPLCARRFALLCSCLASSAVVVCVCS